MKPCKRRTISVRFTMTLSFLSVILALSMTLGLLSYRQAAHELLDKERAYNQMVVGIVNEKLLELFRSIDRVTSALYSYNMQKNLHETFREPPGSFAYNEGRLAFFQSFRINLVQMGLFDSVRRIILIRPDGSVFTPVYYGAADPESLLSCDIFTNAVRMNGKMSFHYCDGEYLLKEDLGSPMAPVLLAVQYLDDLNYAGEFGVFIVELDWERISAAINGIAPDSRQSSYALMDESGRTLYNSGVGNGLLDRLAMGDSLNNKQDEDNRIAFEDQWYIVAEHPIPAPSWRFFSVTPESVLYTGVTRIRDFTVLLALVAMAASAMVSLLFSKSLYKPIRQIMAFTQDVERGVLDRGMARGRFREYNVLIDALNNLVKKLTELIRQNYELSLQEKESELRALRSQINPHFLYNALNAISSCAMLGKTEEIAEITGALSDLLRYNLGRGGNLVTVQEEIHCLLSYIQIQKIRFDEGLGVDIHIDDAILGMAINRFVIQPIVENAFVHGLEKTMGAKKLTISGLRRDDRIIIEVKDNGAGMSAAKLQALTRYLNEEPVVDEPAAEEQSPESSGQPPIARADRESIGLHNVNQRIKLTFGPEYGLSIRSVEGAGSCVTIMIPALPQ